jgi:homoserine kinase
MPAQVPLSDAVHNVSRASLLVLGLVRGDWELVSEGLQDRLHQPRRASLYPQSMALLRRARELGALGATISGAGPSVLFWTHYEATGAVMAKLRPATAGWAQVMHVPFEPQGAWVREL